MRLQLIESALSQSYLQIDDMTGSGSSNVLPAARNIVSFFDEVRTSERPDVEAGDGRRSSESCEQQRGKTHSCNE